VADYPLRLLVQTAADLAAGSAIAPALRALLAILPPVRDPSVRPRCPYPGMVPFSPDDARFFYGREPEIAEMLRRLRVGRYLLVVGPSGPGKSSLVTAGLLPARQYLLPIPDPLALAQQRVIRGPRADERATYLGEALPTPTIAALP
jgi:hypothetical protein